MANNNDAKNENNGDSVTLSDWLEAQRLFEDVVQRCQGALGVVGQPLISRPLTRSPCAALWVPDTLVKNADRSLFLEVPHEIHIPTIKILIASSTELLAQAKRVDRAARTRRLLDIECYNYCVESQRESQRAFALTLQSSVDEVASRLERWAPTLAST